MVFRWVTKSSFCVCWGGGILSHLTKQSCSGISSLLRKKFSGTVGRLQELGNFNCNTFPYQEEWFFFLVYEPGCNLFLNCREQLSTTPWWSFAADCARRAGWREKSVLGMETFEHRGGVGTNQGSGGRGGVWGTSNSSSPLCRWIRWRVFSTFLMKNMVIFYFIGNLEINLV